MNSENLSFWQQLFKVEKAVIKREMNGYEVGLQGEQGS